MDTWNTKIYLEQSVLVLFWKICEAVQVVRNPLRWEEVGKKEKTDKNFQSRRNLVMRSTDSR